MTSVIAVDLGGTKLTTGAVTFRQKAPVDRHDAARSLSQIAAAIREAAASAGASGIRIDSCGLIVPGIYYPATGNAWAPNLWGHVEVPLRQELERQSGLRIVVDSDRAGYVLGEQWLGAAKGSSDVVFLAIGTGIGAGIISGGHLLRGASDIAGSAGWFALNPVWRELYGQIGCWEAEAAGPGLARRLNAESAEQVVAAARAGDPAALKAVHETAQYLGLGIANLVSLLNPEVIVLGGGLMQAADLFLTTMRGVMLQWAQPISARQVRIEVTRLGEDAGLVGAARLAIDSIRN